VLVDSGRFDWQASGRFDVLTRPYAGFHGMTFADESTVAPFLLRARREGLRDFGACMSAHTAFLLLQGLETLPLRMARHVDNARQVVAFLTAQPQVESISYPELASHPPCAGAAAAAQGLRRGVQLRPRRLPRRRAPVRRIAAGVLAPGQCR